MVILLGNIVIILQWVPYFQANQHEYYFNKDTNQDGDRTLFQQQMVVLLSVVLAFFAFLLAS